MSTHKPLTVKEPAQEQGSWSKPLEDDRWDSLEKANARLTQIIAKREEQEKRLGIAEPVQEPVQELAIPYGCHEHIDVPDALEEDFEPDACVLDEGRPSKCAIAFSLYKQGKNQTECEHWRPIKVMTKEKNT